MQKALNEMRKIFLAQFRLTTNANFLLLPRLILWFDAEDDKERKWGVVQFGAVEVRLEVVEALFERMPVDEVLEALRRGQRHPRPVEQEHVEHDRQGDEERNQEEAEFQHHRAQNASAVKFLKKAKRVEGFILRSDAEPGTFSLRSSPFLRPNT